jgi:hypothetical protein
VVKVRKIPKNLKEDGKNSLNIKLTIVHGYASLNKEE